MPPWLSWIVGGLGWLIKAFINRTPSAVAEAGKAGAAEDQAQQEATDLAEIQKARDAADASRAATADPGSLRAPGDPDCRDCGA